LQNHVVEKFNDYSFSDRAFPIRLSCWLTFQGILMSLKMTSHSPRPKQPQCGSLPVSCVRYWKWSTLGLFGSRTETIRWQTWALYLALYPVMTILDTEPCPP